MIIASSTACVIALSWGGVRYPWASVRVLAPLVLGVCGLCAALLYEARLAKEPLVSDSESLLPRSRWVVNVFNAFKVPFSLFTNRTSVSGYAQCLGSYRLCSFPRKLHPDIYRAHDDDVHSLYVTLESILPQKTQLFHARVVDFGATYFQACKGASPGHAGLDLFACSATIGPVLLLTGFWIAYTKTYRVQLWLGWACFTAAMAGMSTVHADTPVGVPIGLFVLACVGGGLVFASAYYPVLAPLPATSNAHAMAFFAFCRSFAGVRLLFPFS